MYYKFLANLPHPLDRAYILCKDKRRPKKDADYLNEILVPLVFEPGSLKDDFELKYFFLERIATFQSKFGGAIEILDTLSMDEIKMIAKPLLLLHLVTKSLTNRGVLQKAGTIENTCLVHGYFGTLGGEDRFYRFVLQRLGYPTIPWYSKIWVPVKNVFIRISAIFASLSFFVYVFTRRRAAYFLYLLLILLFLAVGVMVPRWWKNFNNKKLEKLKQAQTSQVIQSFSQVKNRKMVDKELWSC
jgi:hypothetical protein